MTFLSRALTTGTDSRWAPPRSSSRVWTAGHWAGWMSTRKALGRFVRQLRAQSAREALLDESHSEHEENPQAEGDAGADRRRARPGERQQSLANGRAAGEACQRPDEPHGAVGESGESHGRGGQPGGEEGAEPQRVGLRRRREPDACEDDETHSDAQSPGHGHGLDVAAQHAQRRHPPDGEHRGKGEEQRDADAEQRPARQCGGLPERELAHGQQLSREPRQDRGGCRPESAAQEAADDAEKQRLHPVEGEDLARSPPEASENRDVVDPAREPGLKRIGDADSAEEQRQQCDEADESGDPVERASQLGLRVGEGLDSVDRRVESLAHFLHERGAARVVESSRQRGEQAVADPTAELLEGGPREPRRGDENARPEREGAGDAVGLAIDHPGDAEPLAADEQGIVRSQRQPREQIRSHERFVPPQVADRPRRGRHQLAVEGVAGIGSLELDQQAGAGVARDDRHELPRHGRAGAALFEQPPRRLADRPGAAHRKIRCQKLPRFAADAPVERRRVSGDRDDRGHADGEAAYEEEQATGRRAPFGAQRAAIQSERSAHAIRTSARTRRDALDGPRPERPPGRESRRRESCARSGAARRSSGGCWRR